MLTTGIMGEGLWEFAVLSLKLCKSKSETNQDNAYPQGQVVTGGEYDANECL